MTSAGGSPFEVHIGVLLERDGELAALREAVGSAAERRGSVVLVTGEAGIGKSALVQTWVADPGADARVLVGWCDDFLTSRPLGPVHDVARSAGGALAEALEAGDVGGVLEATLAELAYPLGPTVLLLEDMHWADEATLDVVRYIGRRMHGLPAVLAMTYRDDEIGTDHPLRSVLGALTSSAVHRIALRPLSRGAVAVLTAGSGLDADEVVRVTGGNPFFVTELARGGSAVPASVADAVLARVRKLPPHARAAVEALSVVPGLVTDDLVGVLVPELAHVAEAERGGVLQLDGSSIGFRHELARQAVLDSLQAATRVGHHHRVLDHLLDVAAEPARILHHAVGAGRADIVAVHGPAAASEAYRAGAHREAVAHHERVLEQPELLSAEQLAAVLEEHAWSLYSVLRFADAADAAERAVAVRADLDDAAALAHALLTLSRMRYMTNDPDLAFAAVDRAAPLLQSASDPSLQAELRTQRLSLLYLTDRHDEVLAEGDELIALTAELGRTDLQVYGQVYLGGALVVLDDDRGFDLIQAAMALGREHAQLDPVARSYGNLVEVLMLRRRWDDAAAWMHEAGQFYDDHDFGAGVYHNLAQRARLHTLQGRWAEAHELLEELAELGPRAGVLEAIALGTEAILAVRSGDADADSVLARAWDVAVRTRSAAYIVPVACAALERAWMTGQREFAQASLSAALAAAGSTPWLALLRWRMPLLGADPDATDVWFEPERTSLSGDWRAAADGWAARGLPFERALELLRSGEEAPALEALQILERLGAEPAARMARRQLRDLGVRRIPRGPMPTTRRNPLGLTGRQLDVLVLLNEGLTNTEVAERLYLSPRTVEHHVTAILDKLGVDNRKAAAEAARRLGVLSG